MPEHLVLELAEEVLGQAPFQGHGLLGKPGGESGPVALKLALRLSHGNQRVPELTVLPAVLGVQVLVQDPLALLRTDTAELLEHVAVELEACVSPSSLLTAATLSVPV